MLEHTVRNAAGPGRRWMFRLWVALTVVFSLYVVGVAVLAGHGDDAYLLAGAPVPFLMIALLFLGLGWLAWLVTARRRR